MTPGYLRRARMVGLCTLTLGLSLVAADVPARGQVGDVFYDWLTPGDLVFARATLQDTLERRRSLQPAPWRNDMSGNSGTITPVRTFRVKGGIFCREFRETLSSAGDSYQRVATACRREDGFWILVER